MERVNSNNILNISAGGGDDLLIQEEASENSLEAYTVVLSATAHVLSMIFGGGRSLAIVIAIITRANINRYSYTLVITFLLACCSLNFVWSPMEMTDLIMFHYVHKHPCQRFVAIRTALHLFLILLISIIIVLLSVEGIIRMRNCFGRMLRKVWPLTSSVMAIVFLAVFFVIKYTRSNGNISVHYIIIDKNERFLILLLTVFAFCIVAIMLIILALLFIKETVYWEDGRPRLRRKKMKLEIPEFLISQSNACANNEGGYENSKSDTPSPTTPKLVIDEDGDASSIKGEDSSHIAELPANMVKPTGNRLGINMAHVLGRRRHTICQITDSTSTITTPADHIARAKQYNYVRKFSVDISALQAQLQNPKIFRDAPYQSDIDLTRKQPSESAKPQTPKPLLPLKPLAGNLNEKEDRIEIKTTGAESGSVGTTIHPPPVIMVSNDDALSNNGGDASPSTGDETTSNSGGEDIQKDIQGSNESFYDKSPSKSTTTIQKPSVLYFNESTEEHTSAPTLESAVSGPSDTESEGLKLTRLTILLSLTFVLNMLPVLVTELMETRLARHAFINISTCTLAVSTIQTIVYPHLISSCDDVVHKAIGKLKRRVKIFLCCSSMDAQTHAEDSSSTGQI